jgi:hypothetical protein
LLFVTLFLRNLLQAIINLGMPKLSFTMHCNIFINVSHACSACFYVTWWLFHSLIIWWCRGYFQCQWQGLGYLSQDCNYHPPCCSIYIVCWASWCQITIAISSDKDDDLMQLQAVKQKLLVHDSMFGIEQTMHAVLSSPCWAFMWMGHREALTIYDSTAFNHKSHTDPLKYQVLVSMWDLVHAGTIWHGMHNKLAVVKPICYALIASVYCVAVRCLPIHPYTILHHFRDFLARNNMDLVTVIKPLSELSN